METTQQNQAIQLIKSNPSLLALLGKKADEELENRKIKKARSYFGDFIKFINPKYDFNWHHDYLISKLQLFAEGKIKKMMVFMPPQHGKSELTSRLFPAYALGINPNLKIIGCSYTSELSKKFNRSIQRVISESSYNKVFPKTMLSTNSVKNSAKGARVKTSNLFEIVEYSGSYMNAGVGGGITGNACDIGIIDDPLKGAADAASPTLREKQWDWFNADFSTRLHNDSQILIIMTRWHEDDLAGRLLQGQNAHQWEVVCFPAIKENDNDPNDPRQVGEALWPNRHNLQRLLSSKVENERIFQCVYQQDPRPWVGSLCYPEYKLITAEEFDQAQGSVYYGLDLGYGGDSPTALIACKLIGHNLYFKEIIYQKISLDELSNKIQVLGLSREIIVCDSANPAFIEELKRRGAVNITKSDKPSVEISVATMRENCNIKIVESSRHIIAEIKEYHYIEDAEGVATSKIAPNQQDHALDAGRYIFLYLHKKSKARPTRFISVDFE